MRSPCSNYTRPQGLITEAPGDRGRHTKSKRLLLFLLVQGWQLRCCWPGQGCRASGGHIWESNALRQSNRSQDEVFRQQSWFNTQSHGVNCCRRTNVGCRCFHTPQIQRRLNGYYLKEDVFLDTNINTASYVYKGDFFLCCKANTD